MRNEPLRKQKEDEDNEEASSSKTDIISFDSGLNNIDFLGGVNIESLRQFKVAFKKLEEKSKNRKTKNPRAKKTITITIYSLGGDSTCGLAIYNIIRSSGLPIQTIALGFVASAGLIIFLAGRERLIYEDAILLLHKSKPVLRESSSSLETKISLGQLGVIEKKYRSIVLENSALSARQLDELERGEKYITAQKAVELGLAHKIIENR